MENNNNAKLNNPNHNQLLVIMVSAVIQLMTAYIYIACIHCVYILRNSLTQKTVYILCQPC
jgi:hypothetical protein